MGLNDVMDPRINAQSIIFLQMLGANLLQKQIIVYMKQYGIIF